MSVNVRVIGSGNIDSHFSLLIETVKARYLINCGDGTQRLASEHGAKISNVEHVFLNDEPSGSTIGGLVGFLLTRWNSVGKRIHAHIHGPISETTQEEIACHVTMAADLAFSDTDFDDGNIKVKKIVINGKFAGLEINLGTKPGKLNKEFCELNSLTSAQIRQIYMKKSLEFEGKRFTPEMITSQETNIGKIVVFNSKLNTVHEEHIDKLIEAIDTSTDIVMSPLNSSIESFCKMNNIKYLFSKNDSTSPSNRAALLLRRSILSSGINPLIKPEKTLPDEIICGDLIVFNKEHITYDKKDSIITFEEIQDYFEKRQFVLPELGDELDVLNLSDFNKDRIYLVTLGTGSAIPSKYRNVSSNCILFFCENEWRTFFVDFGEGSLLSMRRTFKECDYLINNCVGVYVTHCHADHYLGLIDLLDTNPDIELFLPKFTQKFLKNFNFKNLKIFDNFSHKNNFFEISSVAAIHGDTECRSALVNIGGKRFAFSGDTRPNEAFIDLAFGVDFMIHEATYGDEFIDKAKQNFHSTLFEAISVAERAQAKNLVLTHFSQRYPRVPPIVDCSTRIIYASDLFIIDSEDDEKVSKISKNIFVYFSN